MKLYITRHGQVAPKEHYGDVQFPAGDPPLTKVGRLQAEYLAKYMQSVGFCGKIFSSPYVRTLETAEIIAAQTGSVIVPWAPMREIMKTQQAAEEFCGLTIEQIRARFSHIAPDAELPYPWWSGCAETEEDVFARVGAGFSTLSVTEDAMFVGHGASAGHLINYLNIPKKSGRLLYNCSLSVFDTQSTAQCKYMETAYLPYNLVGQNTVMQMDTDREKMRHIMQEGITIPPEVENTASFKVLHIGDTSSYTYPYYEALIEKIQPNVILHTGDIADEVKVGSAPDREAEYVTGLRKMADILKKSGADKIYIVPGNNDLLERIKQYAPFAEIVPPDTQVEIGGITCTLAHAWYEVKTDSQWYFYGHGLSNETHTPAMNRPNGVCRFNVIWGPSVYLLPEKKRVAFKRPEDVVV